MQNYARLAVQLARRRGMFIVLDADALFMVSEDIQIIKGYRRAVLTPNVVEFKRLVEKLAIDGNASEDAKAGLVSRALGGVTVLQKGPKDIIAIDTTGEQADTEREHSKETVCVDVKGGMKRCGGQGDILSGAVGTMLAWGKCYEDGAFG